MSRRMALLVLAFLALSVRFTTAAATAKPLFKLAPAKKNSCDTGCAAVAGYEAFKATGLARSSRAELAPSKQATLCYFAQGKYDYLGTKSNAGCVTSLGVVTPTQAFKPYSCVCILKGAAAKRTKWVGPTDTYLKAPACPSGWKPTRIGTNDGAKICRTVSVEGLTTVGYGSIYPTGPSPTCRAGEGKVGFDQAQLLCVK